MKHLSISPLINLLKTSDQREYFKKGDLDQLENKINNLLKNKLANEKQKHSTYVEEEYLAIIKSLKKYFIKHKKLSRQELIEKTDKILVKRNFNYSSRKHKTASDKLFRINYGNANKNVKYYDIAFYNKDSLNYKDSHHSFRGRPAVYYMRCEEFADQLLIGNIQIDYPRYPSGVGIDTSRYKIKMMGKNIYGLMVQQAVKYGLDNNFKKIRFQCGDAVNYAQWEIETPYREVKITGENIARYQKSYDKMSKKFDNLKVGDSPIYGYGAYGVVIEKSGKGYKCYDANVGHGHSNLMSVILRLYAFTDIDNLADQAEAEWLAQKPQKLLSTINKIFEHMGIDVNNHESAGEKIKFLREFISKNKIDDLSEMIIKIDEFLLKFNYDALFLKHHEDYKKINVQHNKNFDCDYCFVDPTDSERCYSNLNKKLLINPELGKTYHVSPDYKFLVEPNIAAYDCNNGDIEIIEWYDTIIPKTLKKFKLDFKKVPIRSFYLDGDEAEVEVEAHALEITGGLEEFKERPLLCFSGLNEFKLDTVSLPKLLTAARKFGLNPEQINIVNDLLVGDDSLKHAGVYNRQTDDIHLANQSLSILAHECLHRVVEKKLIPRKEYRAMVAAGKRLVENTKNANSYGILQYSRGKERNDEYAAIFVEKYYEKEKIARKYLMGAKITVSEKILGYVKETYDIIKAHLGNQPALARAFLRKIEKDQLFNATKLTKTNKNNLSDQALIFQEI